jgi:hypothetical protein
MRQYACGILSKFSGGITSPEGLYGQKRVLNALIGC